MMPTKRQNKWSGVSKTVGLLLVIFLVFVLSGCEQCTKRHRIDVDDSHANGDGVAEDNNTSVTAYSISGGVEDGSLMPEDIGPEAPAVFFLAGLKGYTEPCGCTADVLLGGIDRIVGYVKEARNLHPAVAMIDAGDMLFEHEVLDSHLHPQEIAKVDVLLGAHKRLDTLFTVPGPRDFALGADFYMEKLGATDIGLLAANMSINAKALEPTITLQLDTQNVGFIGLVQESLYEGIEGVSISSASAALEQALQTLSSEELDAKILVFHGELGPAKQLLEQFPAVDFVIIGHGPRETDQVDEVSGNYTLEAYDQGRYVGVLKLYSNAELTGSFVNARSGSTAELEAIDRQVEHVEESIHRIASAVVEGDDPPPMLARLQERLSDLHTRRAEMQGGEVSLPEGQRAFLYRPVAMRPGYPVDAETNELRRAYNRSLRELNADLNLEVVPVEEGQAFYIGTNECKTCHIDAYDFWETTSHSKAMATLEQRDKDFDQNCVGCHVVGWEKPGGSVLGKLTYEANIGDYHFTKDLHNVGCENCHGPGSEHRLAPLDAHGNAQHIIASPTVDDCMQCHVQEHSPRFDFESYVRRITGEGHQLSSPH